VQPGRPRYRPVEPHRFTTFRDSHQMRENRILCESSMEPQANPPHWSQRGPRCGYRHRQGLAQVRRCTARLPRSPGRFADCRGFASDAIGGARNIGTAISGSGTICMPGECGGLVDGDWRLPTERVVGRENTRGVDTTSLWSCNGARACMDVDSGLAALNTLGGSAGIQVQGPCRVCPSL
jgi:hypothetical protein